jgi:flagellar basal-body rod protein FlgF
MADGLYVGMAGATARERQLEALSDDLANAQTPGFKASRPAFATVLAEAGGQRAFPVITGVGSDLRAGPTAQTGNPLDVVPEDGAFLSVQGPDGSTAYTRNGRLSLDASGTLQTAGRPVLTEGGGTIAVPRNATLQIGGKGGVLINGIEVGRLGLFKLEGRAERLGPSLMVPGQGGSATQVQATVETGAIELGNHSALEATVALVSAQRHFDASMQAIETYKKLGDRSSELGRVR